MAIFKARTMILFCYNCFENVVIYIEKMLSKMYSIKFPKIPRGKYFVLVPEKKKMKILQRKNMSNSLKNKEIYS